MKQKFTYLLFLLTFSTLLAFGNLAVAALTVTATGTNGTCASDASITATASGNTGLVNYQLLQGATVIRNYQPSNVFSNLPAGSYIVKVQDATTTATAQSSTVTLTTTYVAMVVTVANGSVGCTTAKGSVVATVTKGKAPYSYSISPDPNSLGTQSSSTFSNLPIGSYTISITDACGTTVTAGASIGLGTSATVSTITPRYQFGLNAAPVVWGNGGNNVCSSGGYITIGGNWGYLGNGSANLSTFDANHFYWRYEYPSGSGNVYGAGGVLNGSKMPCTTVTVKLPATATYPFANGDLIIYDDCNNEYKLSGIIKRDFGPSTNAVNGTYDCTSGGAIRTYINPASLTCLPVTWTIVDNGTSALTTQIQTTNLYNYFNGYVPGHSYTVTGVDAMGNPAKTGPVTVTIPSSPPATLGGGDYYPDYSLLDAGFPRMTIPFIATSGTVYSYVVTSSTSSSFNGGIPAVGYTNSYTMGSGFFGNLSVGQFFLVGPNSDGSWPSGTHTVQLKVGDCYTSSVTFTFSGLHATLNTQTTTPVCGGFNLSMNATLDNPSIYALKIISGPSNVNQTRSFSNATTTTTLNSLPFNGLAYGTYTVALICTSTSSGTGNVPLITRTVTYNASNSLTIDALATGGYVCAGFPTGSLSITATSASGSALEYSKDGGTTWQSSNVFNGVAVGNYPIVVRDICGNTATYTASVVQASGISASASTNPVCAGGSTQLSVNAIGATSYAWTGPNGFTSSLQNPIINNMQSINAGTYTVTVTSPSCSNTASVTIAVNPLPIATIAYSNSSFCATGTANPIITGTTGGTFSSTTGLNINATTGAVNLTASAPGTYTVTYTFSNSGTGCSNTTTASITVNAQPLVVTHNQSTCAPGTVNLTSAAVTTGSTAGLTYTYFTESTGTTILNNPNAVTTSGTYYIKGYLVSTGCYSVPTPVTVTIQPQPTVVITNPASVCAPAKIDLTASGITTGSSSNLAFAYYTNPGATTVLSNPSAVGTTGIYYIQGTNTITGCVSAVMPVTVTVNPLPNAPTVAAIQPACGTPTGSITITGVTGETYSVDGSAFTSTLTYSGLAPGSHTVLAKATGGCTSTATNITINSAKATANAPTVATTQPVCGTPTGSIAITGVTGETYSVDGSAYTSTLTYSGLAPGSHSILAKSTDGCISNATNITISPAKATATAPVFTTAQPACGTPTGSISITAVTGEKYSVDGGSFTATTTYSNLAPGSHTVTSQSIDGCSSAAVPFTIAPAKTVATAPTVSVTAQPICGTPTGSIAITGVTGETYSVDGSAYTSILTYSGLAPGSHSILAKSADGCTSTGTNVTINPAKTVATAPAVSVTSQPICGTPTGSIAITGVTGETYSVDGSAYTSILTYSGLAPGSHSILAKSADGCTSTGTNVTINPAKATANAPAVAVTAQPVCGTPTGSIGITAVAGETYSVDGSAYTATLTYAGLAPGPHAITAKSADGCTSTATNITINPAKTVANAPAVAVTAQPVCGTPTGSISITGVTGETYSVDGSAYTSALTYSGLAPGPHAITAKSSDGCISTATNIAINPAKATANAPAVSVTAQPVCGTPTGSISITAVAGETYSLDGGAYSATLTYSGLAPGLHAVTAKSADGCISNATNITISPAKAAATAPVFTTVQPVCGTPTGSISITAVTDETYSVDGGPFTATTTYANLVPGSHTVTSQSTDGCNSATVPFTIAPAKTVATAPTVSVTAQPECGTPTGSIGITSVAGETYSVDGGAYSATLTYSGLAPGPHTVTAKSADGCTSTATNIIINPAKVTANAPAVAVTAQPVCGTATGSIAITGVTDETYSIDGGAYSASLTYAGLTPGTHIVKARSIDGCVSTGTDVVIGPAKVVAAAPVVTVTAQPTCALATGSISIAGVTGNTYSLDGSAYTAALTYSGLASGSHTVTAKSADGCISNAANITISAQPATPVATIAYGSAQYQAVGTASVIQTGQTGGTYTASPSGLGISGTTGAIDLGASTPNQTYTVTYSFSNGSCTGTATATVRVNSTPATIAYAKPAYCAGGTADIVRTGPANGTYTASASGLKVNASTGTINLGASTPGSYTVTYTYRDGTITATAVASVTVNAMPIVSVSSDLGTDISRGDIATLTATGGSTYSWSGPDIQSGQNTGTLKVRPRQTATYTVTATNASGCSDVAQITINVTDDFKLVPNNVITPNGDGKNDTWVVKNLDYYPNNTVGIYDRAGRKVYGTGSYKNDWDGTYNGQPLAEGAYIYVIDLGKGIGLLRGTISIIRDNR
ncbi:T9SS type B sorting domain-containing protein [Pedobacter paludis]|nr:gliding motility-associated C-terminal domain-containing protein [Pedobacter paludis]